MIPQAHAGKSGAVSQTPGIVEIEPSAAKYTAPWIDPADTGWLKAAPLAGINGNEISAEVRVAVTDEQILISVNVHDPSHLNTGTGTGIWNGDAIQVGIDGRGDGVAGMPNDSRGPAGPDDLELCAALTADGPRGWFHFGGAAHFKAGPMPADDVRVERDEIAKETRYLVRIPWKLLATPPGLSPEIGLAIQINNATPGVKELTHISFGAGADGVPAPGLFERIALGKPGHPVSAAVVMSNTAWDANNPARIRVAVSGSNRQVLRAKLGGASVERTVPGDSGIHRFDIVAGTVVSPAKLQVTSGGLKCETDVISPVDEFASFQKQISELIAKSPHPLFTRHLKSVKSLVETEWARLELYREKAPRTADLTLSRLRSIMLGLSHDAGDWNACLDGRRSLVLAFISPKDGTLQYYLFCLPKDWDPTRAYPLFFELHGAGDANPLSGIAAYVGTDPSAPDLAGYTSPKTYAEIERAGYWCQPFGRGNNRYRNIGETDIFEAYDDVHANFKIDPDRRYLYGFSMGGGGTWSTALRTPDRWAAAAIFSGGLWNEAPDIDLTANVKNLPIWCWVGTEDGLYKPMIAIRDQLMAVGIPPVWNTAEGIGHNYLMEAQKAGIDWMRQFVRKRPAVISYTADNDRIRTVWGFSLVQDIAAGGLAHIDAKIDGSKVICDTKNVRTFDVDLGPDGLGLTGETEIVWNGKPVYRGTDSSIRVDASGGRALTGRERSDSWSRQ